MMKSRSWRCRPAHRSVHYAPGRGKGASAEVFPAQGNQGPAFCNADAYQSYSADRESRATTARGKLVYCWPHVRRRFVKRFENEGSPIARSDAAPASRCCIRSKQDSGAGKDAAVRASGPAEHISAHHRSASSRGWSPALAHHREIPAGRGHPLNHLGALARLIQISSTTAPSRWNHPVENQIRPIALREKMHSSRAMRSEAENWAMLASLVATCKMGPTEPGGLHCRHAVRLILDGHPQVAIEDLMLGA